MLSQTQSQNSTPSPQSWFKNYSARPGCFDECLDAAGNIRPHWQEIARKFENIPQESWDNRKFQLDKLIHDYGVTYDLYSEDSGMRSNWSLDMIPNCLPESEMKRIESMLSQRALLLNLTLQDIYGRQQMLKEGMIDPYLVFGNPGYLRPCHGLIGPKQKHIHIYAADIARSPSGNWRVLSDRLESASGLGYALEHRALMSRVFPVVMAESGTMSLQPFINDFCRYIDALAPSYVDTPRIALMSSGPKHPNYFEQSFLARNLGFHLVEGADLTVRNNRLYMKTVSGVQAVDVLLRRVNSSWCDPLELHNHSLLGVPGLVNVIRQGNLTVANGLGSGVAESTALSAFLPGLSRKFLGEALECPSVATWWCGQKQERDYVLEHIDELVIKPTIRNPQSPVYFGPNLSKAQRSELIARIKQHPERYCGLEIISQATIPSHSGNQLAPSNFVMRVLMIPSGNGWKIMPGGLVRYGDSEQTTATSLQRGGCSKDTWVIGDHSTKSSHSQHVGQVTPKRHKRITDDLPSRTADNLFWLGRYLERSESLARLLKTLSSQLISQASNSTLQAATPFINLLPDMQDPNDFQLNPEPSHLTLDEAEKRMIQALYNRDAGLSLLSNLDHIERSAAAVKERLSSDTWLRLLTVCEVAKTGSIIHPSSYNDSVIHTLDSILNNLSGFIGNLLENMTRSLGWVYLQIGRRIERALAIARILHQAFESEQITEDDLLEYLLYWADSSITYRRLYLNAMDPVNVLDLVCFDESNPRSLAYQSSELQTLMRKLPHSRLAQRHPIDLCTLKLHSRIGLNDSEQLIEQHLSGSKKSVTFFEHLISELESLSVEFDKTYFTPTADAADSATSLSI